MTYKEMDGILNGIEIAYDVIDNGKTLLANRYGMDKVEIIENRLEASEHKRKMPKTFRIKN